MKLVIAREIPAIIIITLCIAGLMIYAGNQIKKTDPLKKPKGIVFLALFFVETIDKLVGQNMDKEAVDTFGPYIGTIALFIFISNISGLTGFLYPPTASLSVTLSFALITWFLIEKQSFKSNGVLGYIKNLFDPLPLFLIPNVFGHISPLISLSFRLFGNILSGSVIMGIVYWATTNLSHFVFGLLSIDTTFNIFGIVIAPVLHMYFDIFAGLLQMFVFISLTMVLIQKEKE